MDIQMPIMDGVTELKSIRANTFNNKTPMVAVTAHALSGEKEKLLQEGFNGYITKPIDETMLRHSIYEYCDLELFMPAIGQPKSATNDNHQEEKTLASKLANSSHSQSTEIIDWSLALKRTGNKIELAKDMLEGLVKSLPETKQYISDALTSQDIEQIKTLIHKLNGACCYTGVPSLGKITHHIETQLKLDFSLDDLEPEFFEFFEHLDNVLAQAPKFLEEV